MMELVTWLTHICLLTLDSWPLCRIFQASFSWSWLKSPALINFTSQFLPQYYSLIDLCPTSWYTVKLKKGVLSTAGKQNLSTLFPDSLREQSGVQLRTSVWNLLSLGVGPKNQKMKQNLTTNSLWKSFKLSIQYNAHSFH